jgi:ArsR family transcriptional regulator
VGSGEDAVAVPDDVKQALDEQGGIEAVKQQLPPPDALRQESRLFHTLSDPIRLSILYLLASQPLCVCLIKDILHVPDSKLSYHLSVLQSMGLIRGERQANWIVYHETPLGRDVVGIARDLVRMDRDDGPPQGQSVRI